MVAINKKVNLSVRKVIYLYKLIIIKCLNIMKALLILEGFTSFFKVLFSAPLETKSLFHFILKLKFNLSILFYLEKKFIKFL
jgi:hypothetical protein